MMIVLYVFKFQISYFILRSINKIYYHVGYVITLSLNNILLIFIFIDKLAFQFKMQTKMLERQSATHDKQEKIERDKVKKALMKGNMEAAKIHAENAIRHHSESLNCKRMAARVDGVQARVANSAAQRQVSL